MAVTGQFRGAAADVKGAEEDREEDVNTAVAAEFATGTGEIRPAIGDENVP